MFQFEKLSVSVAFTEETQKSLEYVLSFATEIGAQFIVLQVMERKAERYSLIFPVALLEKWPFAGKSVPTIPLSALPQDKSADLAGVDRLCREQDRDEEQRALDHDIRDVGEYRARGDG